MSRPIGYYVHHQGDGHRQRAVAIAGEAPERFVLIGSGLGGRCEGLRCVDLPDDRPTPDTRFAEPSSVLHYLPLDHAGVRRRLSIVAEWIARQRPQLMVIDVSVEIAMLAQLSGTPAAYMRLAGLRNDTAHLTAFAAARAVIAPFAAALDSPSTESWVREKTRYLPGLTRARQAGARQPDTVLVVNGCGGAALDGAVLAAAAAATPLLHWRAIGPVTPPRSMPSNLRLLGWVNDADDEIARAEVVVGSAGDGVVNAVIASGARFVCLPQARYYDEQVEKAGRLEATGAAIVIHAWPDAAQWPALFERASRLDPAALAALHAPHGAQRAADLLLDIADGDDDRR